MKVKELNSVKAKVKEKFFEEVEKRIVEQLFTSHTQRIDNHVAKVVDAVQKDIEKEFPI